MDASKRFFLRTFAGLKAQSQAQGMGASAAFALNMAALGQAAAQSSSVNDYKAIVCLFMHGGNDSHNWIVPWDSSNYELYRAARGGLTTDPTPGLALTQSQLDAIVTPTVTERQFAMAKSLAPLRELYDQGKAAVVANVGPLITPTTKAQYAAGSVSLPPKLFSHNDQSSIWQASAPEGARAGWAGRMGDLLASNNSEPVFTNISVTGNTVLLAGLSTVQYQVSSSGSITMRGYGSSSGQWMFNSTQATHALKQLLADEGTSLLQKEYTRVVQRSISANDKFSSSVIPASAVRVLPTTSYGTVAQGMPGSVDQDPLAKQLQMVARMIGSTMGTQRQVFMVSIGGFDTHDLQNTAHPILSARVANCIRYFYDALTDLGKENQVTLFTASDFGRTLSSNGKGSDHGWGAHHFVVGGAVKGGDLYGEFPLTRVSSNSYSNPHEVGSGRYLPSTSVEQYAATMGRWFGLSDSELLTVFPNLTNFSQRTLGFMT
jgi:uncharacterized protein (DUF1501 family)